MLKQQLLNKKNIFLALCAIAVLILYAFYEFGYLESFRPGEKSAINADANQGGSVAVIDSDIVVSSPISNDSVNSPLEISGRAKANSSFIFYIRNSLDQVVASTTLSIRSESDDWVSFFKEISFPNPLTPTGILQIVPDSSGEVLNIPVSFPVFADLPVVDVFFSSIKEDPEVLNCDIVYPLPRRILSETATVPSVLQALFLGLSDKEMVEGYVNNLPEDDIRLLSFDVQDGVATVDFSESLDDGGGACRKMAIRAQITETLRQFNNIEEVVITIEGEINDVLQP